MSPLQRQAGLGLDVARSCVADIRVVQDRKQPQYVQVGLRVKEQIGFFQDINREDDQDFLDCPLLSLVLCKRVPSPSPTLSPLATQIVGQGQEL